MKRSVFLFILLAAFEVAQAFAQAMESNRSLVGTWHVNVERIPDNEVRILKISADPTSNSESEIVASYGLATRDKRQVATRIIQNGDKRQILVVTQARSIISADEQINGTFFGTFVTKSGKSYPVRLSRAVDKETDSIPATTRLATSNGLSSDSSSPTRARKIVFINMGGNDCPPCVGWRLFELPKLQKSNAFDGVQYIHVDKGIRSAVPPTFFLPDPAKPYKSKLDTASSGMIGSPQVAILVDDEIYDYYFGARSAEDIIRMIDSIRWNKKYPFERCLKRRDSTHCLQTVSN